MGLPATRLTPGMDNSTMITVLNNNAAQLENADISLIVDKGTVQLLSATGTINDTYFEHNLDFTPAVRAYVNNASVGSITTDGSLLLPTWTNLFIDTTNHEVNFTTYVQCIPDSKYIHFVTFNATGTTLPPIDITYYILKETSAL